MVDYSPVNGRIPVKSSTDRVWEMEKKSKTGDQQRQSGKKPDKKKKEKDTIRLLSDPETEPLKAVVGEDETADYSVTGRGKKMGHTIDVKI